MKIWIKIITSKGHIQSPWRASGRARRYAPVVELFSAAHAFSSLLSMVMRRSILIYSVVAALMVMIWIPTRAMAEDIDRLLAAVNGKVITEGDLKLSRFLNDILTFRRMDAKPPDGEEIQRLIDLELLRQELVNFPGAPGQDEQVEGQMADLKKSYADKGGLAAMLVQLGLQESELRAYLRLQASVQRFVDFRFRPFISVSQEEIQEYYRTKLVPQLQKPGAPIPALEDVSSKILEILTEEKVNSSLNQWLQDSRRHLKIEYFEEDRSMSGR